MTTIGSQPRTGARPDAPEALRLPDAATLDETDGDWERIRDRAIGELVASTGATWTDHNPTDPGITLLEAAAFALADLHYRTDRRDWSAWSAEVGGLGTVAHRPSIPALPDDRHTVARVATWLGDASDADLDALYDAVAAAPSRRQAISAVERLAPAGLAPVSIAEAGTVTDLVRRPHFERLALDRAADIERIIDQNADGPNEAAEIRLRETLGDLWSDEATALLALGRARRASRLLADHRGPLTALVSGSSGRDDATARLDDPTILQQSGLDDNAIAAVGQLSILERAAALGLHPSPPGTRPEAFEEADGSTTLWPPHPVQVLSSEPVTASDYRGLARTGTDVRRAWVVPERLPGIDWDGRPNTTRSAEPGDVTLLVERERGPGAVDPGVADTTFLRRVLHEAIGGPGGAELDHTAPFQIDSSFTFLQADLDAIAPRRVIGDRVGVALLRTCPITIKGVLHVGVSTNRGLLVTALREAVAQFLGNGRPESATSDPAAPGEPEIDGPWPPPPPMPTGWVPGAPIRVSELVQILLGHRDVIGVRGVEARSGDGAWFGDEVVIEPDCIPVLADGDCLRVQIELERDCGP